MIYDSEGISEHWLKTLHGQDVVSVSYYSATLKTTLESTISEGLRYKLQKHANRADENGFNSNLVIL